MSFNAKQVQGIQDIVIFNHTPLKMQINGVSSIAIKSANTPVMVFEAVNGEIDIDTADFAPGAYTVQYFAANDEIKGVSKLDIKQNLKYASQDYDPRSPAEIALDAITAFMQGRATAQQRHIKVGDKEIEYSSFEQLLKWKNYFQKQVKRESGKASKIRHEKLTVVER